MTGGSQTVTFLFMDIESSTQRPATVNPLDRDTYLVCVA